MSIRRGLEAGIDWTLRRSPAQALHRRRGARHLAVLAYHAVTDPESFERQLDYVTANLHPVALADVLAAQRGESALPWNAALVTFDDGDPSVLDVAAPMLSERGIPAVAFVIAGTVGSDSPHWWDEVLHLMAVGAVSRSAEGLDAQGLIATLKHVPDGERVAVMAELRESVDERDALHSDHLSADALRSLEARGIEVGHHTMTHPCLPRCKDDKVRREIYEAHERMTEFLGHPPRAFAYPNGDWDARAEHHLQTLGYQFGFLFDHRLASLAIQSPLRLSRIRVNATASVDRFAILVSGLHSAVHRFRGLP